MVDEPEAPKMPEDLTSPSGAPGVDAKRDARPAKKKRGEKKSPTVFGLFRGDRMLKLFRNEKKAHEASAFLTEHAENGPYTVNPLPIE